MISREVFHNITEKDKVLASSKHMWSKWWWMVGASFIFIDQKPMDCRTDLEARNCFHRSYYTKNLVFPFSGKVQLTSKESNTSYSFESL